MRQSIEHDEDTNQLIFNGNCTHLGAFNDIKNSYTPKETPVVFQFTAAGYPHDLSLYYVITHNESDDFVGDIREVRIINEAADEIILGQDSNIVFWKLIPEKPIQGIWHIPIDFLKIHYIAADRLGPQKYYEKKTLGKFINVGSRGENVANVLHLKANHIVDDRLYLGQDARTLEQQIEEWLREIFGEAKITLKGKEEESSILTLLLNNSPTDKRYKPSNIGFGYSYILPIIISGLIAGPGEMLIVENPEAHLHPKAQSRLTQFLLRVASCGVQVLIESHSEHILNTLRICVKNKDYSLTPQDAAVLYFTAIKQDCSIIRIPINEDGSIDDWPENFFDQSEKDLQMLLGF
jgi:predicted ATPase